MDIIRVLIADDHSMVMEGLKQLLELDGDIKIVKEVADGNECLEALKDTKVDVILLDINMPNVNGLEVLETLRKEKNNTKVIILTIHNEIDYLLKAVNIGVNGYVLKDSSSAVLRKAILNVYHCETFIEPSLAPYLRMSLHEQKEEQKVKGILTDRETEVLKLLAEGLFNKEIAFNLGISEKTVKNHASSIFKKIGVSDRTQAAIFAIKNNIVEL